MNINEDQMDDEAESYAECALKDVNEANAALDKAMRYTPSPIVELVNRTIATYA